MVCELYINARVLPAGHVQINQVSVNKLAISHFKLMLCFHFPNQSELVSLAVQQTLWPQVTHVILSLFVFDNNILELLVKPEKVSSKR